MPTYDQPTPNPINCWIGRGSVFVGLYDASGDFTGLHHLGNARDLRTQPQIEYATLAGFTTPGAGIVAKEEVSKRVMGAITLYEVTHRNLALLTGGTARTYSQSAQSVSGEPLTPAALRGAFYSTRYRNVADVVLTQGTTTLTTSDWSLVDATAGLLKLLSTGNATEGAPLNANYAAAAISSQKIVDIYASGATFGQIIYRSANPMLSQGELRLHRVCLEPGALENLLGDGFFYSTLGFELMDDSAGKSGGSVQSPYGRWFFPIPPNPCDSFVVDFGQYETTEDLLADWTEYDPSNIATWTLVDTPELLYSTKAPKLSWGGVVPGGYLTKLSKVFGGFTPWAQIPVSVRAWGHGLLNNPNHQWNPPSQTTLTANGDGEITVSIDWLEEITFDQTGVYQHYDALTIGCPA